QPTSSTSFPRTWPCSLTRCAWATSASGKVWVSGSQKRPDPAPGDIERGADAAGRERANSPGQALPVGDGLGPQRAKAVVACRPPVRAAPRSAAPRGGGRFGRRRGPAAPGKPSDGGIGAQCDSTASSAWAAPSAEKTEHPIPGGHACDARAELVDHARRLVAQGLRELPIHHAWRFFQSLRLTPAACTATRT